MLKKIKNISIILLGISFIIFIHELGHFLVGLYYNADIISFNIGFGYSLLSFTYDNIIYSINLIPLGGYVEFILDNFNLKNHSLFELILILFSGPLFSFVIGYFMIKYYYKYLDDGDDNKEKYTEVGPLLMFKKLYSDLEVSKSLLFLTLSFLSISLAIINMFPIYPFDGGKIIYFILIYNDVGEIGIKIYNTISIFVLGLLFIYVLYKDLKRLKDDRYKKHMLILYVDKLHIILFYKYIEDMKKIGQEDMNIINKEFVIFLDNMNSTNKIYEYLLLDKKYLNEDNSFTEYTKILIKEYYKLINNNE